MAERGGAADDHHVQRSQVVLVTAPASAKRKRTSSDDHGIGKRRKREQRRSAESSDSDHSAGFYVASEHSGVTSPEGGGVMMTGAGLQRAWWPANFTVPPPRVEEAVAGDALLRVLTFNILSDFCAWHFETKLYSHAGTPVERAAVLTWEARWQRVAAALTYYNADIVALQEVDRSRWPEVKRTLKRAGYACSEAFKQAMPWMNGVDGVVVAWRTSRLRRVSGSVLRFDDAHAQASQMQRRQVAVGVELAVTNASAHRARIFVLTTHVVFDPADGPGKKYQIDRLLSAAGQFLGMRACPPLVSAYASVHGAEPAYTSAHDRTRDTVDYIWLHGAKCTAVRAPSAHEQQRVVGLPSLDHGSDHLPVVAELEVPAAPAVILLGDFNLCPGSPLYHYLAAGGRGPTAAAFNPRHPHYIPQRPPHAWSGLADEPQAFRDKAWLYPPPW
eukprot:TRINITY_DN13166_c0_g2_i1.p1 TRINITY_DN13166_c0_g2~~TRINITY_DN13166_c0_g2_i1.p1  ORF type:complete len:444 (+),score=77.49 TRINITY_DN13166_c0_g2_i1:77-1408(+)